MGFSLALILSSTAFSCGSAVRHDLVSVLLKKMLRQSGRHRGMLRVNPWVRLSKSIQVTPRLWLSSLARMSSERVVKSGLRNTFDRSARSTMRRYDRPPPGASRPCTGTLSIRWPPCGLICETDGGALSASLRLQPKSRASATKRLHTARMTLFMSAFRQGDGGRAGWQGFA